MFLLRGAFLIPRGAHQGVMEAKLRRAGLGERVGFHASNDYRQARI